MLMFYVNDTCLIKQVSFFGFNISEQNRKNKETVEIHLTIKYNSLVCCLTNL